MRLDQRVVDVGTEGVQWNAAFLVVLAAGNLCAVHTASDVDLDALSPEAHGARNGHLDGTAVADARFDLACDTLSHQARVQFGALDFENVDLHILASQLLQFFTELVHLRASFADDDTGAGGLDGHRHELQGALNDDVGHAGLAQTCHQVGPDLVVLHQLVGVVLAAVPVGVPSADETEAVADWIRLLSHD